MNIFREKDRVFDYAYGWGTVTRISSHTFIDYKVEVKYDEGGSHHYTLDGRAKMNGKKVLSFEEYDITKPINHLAGIERNLHSEVKEFIKDKLESNGLNGKNFSFNLELNK